ncbi:N-acetyltransferase [Kribbella antibiotica]|uniref:N-acetyltransferase n=2 Tax=Kribbella antibiotica TaxID=190195 RepID=A0A4V2YQ14_9ACTN|nr:N-acetyltransferase [Kribbella antibiotica]
MAEVELRDVEDGDLDALFEMMRDPESVRMAAFTSKDPNDRTAFDAHVARLRSSPELTFLAITRDGEFAGTVGSFEMEGDTEVTYWVGRAFWGQGIAGQALALLLQIVPTRPIHARAASDNAGSLRVLEKAGFVITGTDTGYANARGAEIEETILRLS